MPTGRDRGPWSQMGLDINEWPQGFTNVFHISTLHKNIFQSKTDLTP